MAEEFTSIVTEAYLNGAWVDLSALVRQNPHPRVNGIGILDNTLLARVGDVGTYDFTLKNINPSTGALGYFTPYHDNMITGWDVGVPVRLTFNYDGYSMVKFYGTIDLDGGIQVETGKYRGRSVSVRAVNWMAQAAKHTLSLQYQTNVRGDQAMQCILDNMSIQPPAVRMEYGSITFPTMFDITKANTKAMAEFQKIAVSEMGYVYQKGDGTLEFMPFGGTRDLLSDKYVPAKSSTSTDKILLESGGTDGILLEDGSGDILMEQNTLVSFVSADADNMVGMSVSYGKEMANSIKAVTYPRDVDAAVVVLWSSEEPIEILAGETLNDIFGAYRDPSNPDIKLSGIEMVVPVSGTDFQMWSNPDGLSGTNRTSDLVVVAEYFTGDVQYTLTNNNAATSYIGLLQARGKGVHIEQEQSKLYERTTSITSYGKMPMTVNFPYLAGVTDLFNVVDKEPTDAYGAGGVFRGLDFPSARIDQVDYIVNKDSRLMMAFLFCEPSDTFKLYETMTDGEDSGSNMYDSAKTIHGYGYEIINGKTVKWSLVLKRTGFHR